MKKLIKYILILAFLTPAIAFTTEDNDPLEGLNRAVYDFNEAVDGAVIKPVAKGYKAVMPNFAVKGVNNFYNNIPILIIYLFNNLWDNWNYILF